VPQIRTKLPDVGTTIFTIMSRLAAEHGAINLSQGFPDFDAPEGLRNLVTRAMRDGRNQYPPMPGVPALREQIAAKVRALYGNDADPETDVTVTSGATEAVFVAVQACVGRGDEVIILDPAFDCYAPAVALAGGVSRHVPLVGPDFKPDWDRLRDAINERTRLVMINSPHNPTGGILDSGDLDTLADLVRDTGAFVLSDEVYEHMIFDGHRHDSVLAHAELADRAFAVFSFGKTYHATGWKVGYCVAPTALSAEFRKIHQYVTFATHAPTQWALAEFMATCPEHARELPAFYQAKRDRFIAEMRGAAFALTPSAGTYFQLADYSAISDAPDTEFANWLTTDVGVAAIPVSVFYAEPPPAQRLVRFCFAKDDDTLAAAGAKLRALEAAA
jgi:methionine aminotransferase